MRQLPTNPQRILVINVARIGDTLLAVPVLRALRHAYPDAQIHYLGHPKRIEVVAGLPYIDRCLAITKRSAFLRGRFGKSYDLALVYGRDPALLDYALRAARHVVALATGDARRDARLFARIEEGETGHAVPGRLLWLDAIGIPHSTLRLEYKVTKAERDWAERWLETQGCSGRPLIGFQVASFPTKAYRNWPMNHFRQLGQRILENYPQARIVIFGDKPDAEPAAALTGDLGERATTAAGRLTLRQTAAIMERLDLYVGVDTGPTHLAGALGIPMVAMYHCLHRGRHLAPLQHPAYLGVVEHPASDAEASASRGMDEIPVDEVWRHVKDALSLLMER